MALRCQFIVAPEHELSGNDEEAIEFCSKSTDHYHPWISAAQAEAMRKKKPASGGGASLNGGLKRRIVNWGLTDAVIAVGPMRTYLNQTVEEAIGQFDNTNARERAIVTESLGSFVVLDALRGKQTRGFVEKASNLTFFANQLALLELARIGFVPPKAGQSSAAVAGEKSPVAELGRVWALDDKQGRPAGTRRFRAKFSRSAIPATP